MSQEQREEQERRRFHRFPFHANCELLLEGHHAHDCELLDLSINGALVQLSSQAEFDSAHSGDLKLRLRGLVDGNEVDMLFGVRAVRMEQERVACRFVEVGPQSFEQLKTLVADNLGDLSMLDRELTQLDYWPGLSVSPGLD